MASDSDTSTPAPAHTSRTKQNDDEKLKLSYKCQQYEIYVIVWMKTRPGAAHSLTNNFTTLKFNSYYSFTHNIKCFNSIFKWHLVAFYYDISVIYVTSRIGLKRSAGEVGERLRISKWPHQLHLLRKVH